MNGTLENLNVFGVAEDVHKVLEKTGTYRRVQRWFLRKTACDVLVIGPSGVGKSSFLKAIQGQIPNIRRDYRTEQTIPTYANFEGSYFKLIDTPGQDAHAMIRKKAIMEAVRSQDLGIINVVSFGYHEGLARTEEAVSENVPVDEFLEERRAAEIDMMLEWLPTLCGPGGSAKWLITVVTKADLWWSDSDSQSVLEYYRSNKFYGEHLRNLESMPTSVHPFSSTNKKFYDQVPMSGHYDDGRQNLDRDLLIARMIEHASGSD